MHPYGWLSLLPSIVAIVLAIATRRVVLSLLAGIFVGALFTTSGNVLAAVEDTLVLHLWRTFTEPGKLRVFSFTITLGAMIGIIHRCGGMFGLVEAVKPFAHTRRSGQVVTWLMGLVVFFDDYTNTLLLGSTFRPLCDRLKISRAKLAYIVDSTAAPVAGLALVSTWVAVEIDYVQEGLDNLPSVEGLSAFDLFLHSIPYRFYMLMALFFVPLTAVLRRDFGPMLRAEQRRVEGGDVAEGQDAKGEGLVGQIADGKWYHAVVPIITTLVVVLGLLYWTGWQTLLKNNQGHAPTEATLREIIGGADSSLALQYGAICGLASALVLVGGARLLTVGEVLRAAGRGIRVVLPAIAILTTAATLSRMTSNRSVDGEFTSQPYEFRDHRLYTGDYLKLLIAPNEDQQPIPDQATSAASSGDPELARDLTVKTLPTVVFVLASVVAFCTGTSWGTMGILMPMVVTLAHALLSRGGASVDPGDPILLSSIGSVLAGAVFGDHCSPISDTTVLSSQSSGCDHIEHVRTQLPYALAVAIVAILLGTLPVGWGVVVWLVLPAQLAALVGVLLLLGKHI